ncbi:MAG: hypothetical protein ABJA66_09005 [Actinomycetota bacterium]
MNDLERNYYNAFVGGRNFDADNAADFKSGSTGANKFAAVGVAALEMEQSGRRKRANDGAERFGDCRIERRLAGEQSDGAGIGG